MISDFLVQHPSGPFFELDPREYDEALKAYPELEHDDMVSYVIRTATGSIDVGGDLYFTNEIVLNQFARLFKMLKFKKAFAGHNIEIVVDNARTHTARSYSSRDFGKSIGTRCPVDTLEFTDSNGSKRKIDTHFKSGPQKGRSKGLLEIAKELKVDIPGKISLDELRNRLNQHPAFMNVRTDQCACETSFFFFR